VFVDKTTDNPAREPQVVLPCKRPVDNEITRAVETLSGNTRNVAICHLLISHLHT
jgi:hypothetical protein